MRFSIGALCPTCSTGCSTGKIILPHKMTFFLSNFFKANKHHHINLFRKVVSCDIFHRFVVFLNPTCIHVTNWKSVQTGNTATLGGKVNFYLVCLQAFSYQNIYLTARYVNIYVYKYMTTLIFVLSPLNLKIFLGLLYPSRVKPLGLGYFWISLSV